MLSMVVSNKVIFTLLFLALTLMLVSINTLSSEIEIPNSITMTTNGQEKIIVLGNEVDSPSDWVKEDQIKVYEDKIILELSDVTYASFTNTNSMDPLIDETANGIEIMPNSPEEIQVGDIISYRYQGYFNEESFILHRVISIDEDEEGIYYTVQGDNNLQPDSTKVRFSDVTGVLVAVIY